MIDPEFSTQWWEAKFTQAILVMLSLLALVHPGFKVPGYVQADVPIAAAVAAAVSQWILTHYIHKAKVLKAQKMATPAVAASVAAAEKAA